MSRQASIFRPLWGWRCLRSAHTVHASVGGWVRPPAVPWRRMEGGRCAPDSGCKSRDVRGEEGRRGGGKHQEIEQASKVGGPSKDRSTTGTVFLRYLHDRGKQIRMAILLLSSKGTRPSCTDSRNGCLVIMSFVGDICRWSKHQQRRRRGAPPFCSYGQQRAIAPATT